MGYYDQYIVGLAKARIDAESAPPNTFLRALVDSTLEEILKDLRRRQN